MEEIIKLKYIISCIERLYLHPYIYQTIDNNKFIHYYIDFFKKSNSIFTEIYHEIYEYEIKEEELKNHYHNSIESVIYKKYNINFNDPIVLFQIIIGKINIFINNNNNNSKKLSEENEKIKEKIKKLSELYGQISGPPCQHCNGTGRESKA